MEGIAAISSLTIPNIIKNKSIKYDIVLIQFNLFLLIFELYLYIYFIFYFIYYLLFYGLFVLLNYFSEYKSGKL